MLDEELAAGEEVAGGFVEHEAERAHVDAPSGPLAGIEKLNIAVLVEPELKSLGGVVHFGRNHGVGHLQLIGIRLVNVEQ